MISQFNTLVLNCMLDYFLEGYDLENNVMLSQSDFFNLGEGFDSFK